MAWHTSFNDVNISAFLHRKFKVTLNALGGFTFRVELERFKEDRAAVKVLLIDDEGEAAKFTLESHPKCSGIADSIDTFVAERHRNKKIAQFLSVVKCELAIYLGFSMLLATVITSNDIENHILLKNKWVKGETFNNKRTGHDVIVWTYKLNAV